MAKLLGLPGHDDPKQDIRPTVKDWLEKTESDFILVLDNADNKFDFFPETEESASSDGELEGLAEFIPLCSNSKAKPTVLITTRDYELADDLAQLRTLHKETMHLDEAMALFKLHYPGADEIADNEPVLQVLEAVEYLPLAVVQIAAYLRQTKMSPPEYLTEFKKTRSSQKRLLSRPCRAMRKATYVSDTVLTTFYISFKQVREQSPLAGSLLEIIACIDRQGIPHELLAV